MKPTIAIVDDDSIFQFTTKVKLQKLALTSDIQIFNDGEEILDYIKDENNSKALDIILLDINMLMLDGWDFLEVYDKLALSSEQKQKIFMLSSSINPVDVEKAKNNKWVIDYITKPISDDDLHRIFTTDV